MKPVTRRAVLVLVAATAGSLDGMVPDTNGQVSLTGLTDGQEVRVEYDDALGVTVDSLIYLPSTFPALAATTTGTPQPGDVFINVAGYAAAVDQNAVPVFLMSAPGGADFKRQPKSSGWTPITGYVVRYQACRIGSGTCTLHLRTVHDRTVTLTSLSPTNRYHVRVRAVNKAGYSPYTAAVTAVPHRS